MTMRVAMWSGPRNLSTAMMYSFAQRPDAVVVDEPFYANYLAKTGLSHPMREEILASQPQEEDEVIDRLLAPLPKGKSLYYLKLMTHHFRKGMRMDWTGACKNVLLLRHPARVIASYGVKRAEFGAEDLGFPQQLWIYDWLVENGHKPIVIESADIRANPKAMLGKLCDALGIEFDEVMLTWPKGGNTADGAWAPHWYGAVHASTGFAGAEGELPTIGEENRAIYEACMESYEKLVALKL